MHGVWGWFLLYKIYSCLDINYLKEKLKQYCVGCLFWSSKIISETPVLYKHKCVMKIHTLV